MKQLTDPYQQFFCECIKNLCLLNSQSQSQRYSDLNLEVLTHYSTMVAILPTLTSRTSAFCPHSVFTCCMDPHQKKRYVPLTELTALSASWGCNVREERYAVNCYTSNMLFRWSSQCSDKATGWGSHTGREKVPCSKKLRPALAPIQIPSQWVSGAIFSRVNRPGREAGHSTPFNTEGGNEWSYISNPQICFNGWCNVLMQKFTTEILVLRRFLEL